MGAAKGRDLLTGAGQQVATGSARESTETLVPYILARDAGIQECVGYFLHDCHAPCSSITTRRTYALAAFYVYELLRDVVTGCGINSDVLTAILRSSLHMRRGTAEHVIRSLEDAGLLEREDCEDTYGLYEVDLWPL